MHSYLYLFRRQEKSLKEQDSAQEGVGKIVQNYQEDITVVKEQSKKYKEKLERAIQVR